MREHICHIYCVCMHVPAHTCMHTCVPVVYYIQECRCMRVCYSSARASSIESDILQALGLHPTIINHHHEADFRASRHGAMEQWFSILFQLVDRFDNKSRSTQTALCSLCQTLSVCSLIYSSSDSQLSHLRVRERTSFDFNSHAGGGRGDTHWPLLQRLLLHGFSA